MSENTVQPWMVQLANELVSDPKPTDYKTILHIIAALAPKPPACPLYKRDAEGNIQLHDYDLLLSALRDARKALDSAVWRPRITNPYDPFCFLCGASQSWASEHGHLSSCAISVLDNLLPKN